MHGSRGVILVEGISDQAAVAATAHRLGRDLEAEHVSIVPMGGASALSQYLDDLQGFGGAIAGLCDEGEVEDFERGLERAGLGTDLSRVDMEALGFYVCVLDLEDELIRALGVDAVEQVIDTQGELGAFRTLQHQPAWQGRPEEEQLRRWFGAGARRKVRYARLLVEAMEPTQVPAPLHGVLARV